MLIVCVYGIVTATPKCPKTQPIHLNCFGGVKEWYNLHQFYTAVSDECWRLLLTSIFTCENVVTGRGSEAITRHSSLLSLAVPKKKRKTCR